MAVSGHDPAILRAFAGKVGEIGGRRTICRLIRQPFSLRLNAKSGIVVELEAAGSGLPSLIALP